MGRTRGRKPPQEVHKLVVPLPISTIRPGNDFYLHINKKWLQQTALPAYESSYGVSEEIEDQIRTRLLGCIRSLVHKTSDKHEVAVHTFFKSGQHANFHKDHMKTFMQQLSALQCLRGPEDYSKQLADFVATGVPTLLNVGIGRDLEHPEVNVLTLSPGYLSLPDVAYYKGDAPGKMETLVGFETLMRRIGHELHFESLERIASLESHIADIYKAAEDDEPFMASGAQLKSKYPAIPWDIFWEKYGLGQPEKKSFLIQSDRWLKWLNRHFRIAPAADWILMFRVQLILYFAPLLTSPIDTLYFNYFGRRLRGDREKMSMENLLYYLAQGLMMPSLSAIYSKCCLPAAHVASARNFASRIRASAMKRIAENDWLSAEARHRSREKVQHMDMRIAETDTGAHYKLPELSEVDIVYNVLALGRAATDRYIHYAEHPELDLPVMDANFEVNAHYYTSGNRLVIPGGITLWPFYDSAVGQHLGWCYGGLGVVIGHEMLHGFDEDGSRYNQDGVYRPWWSRADLAAYARRTKALIRLFSSTRYMGRFLSGKSTLSENIADLGGMAIALDALKREMSERRLDEAEQKKELRAFFISDAVSWRTKERRQRSLYRLFTDSHAPAEVRVNRIVSHFQEWYDIFGVTAEDALYIDPKDRIAIF